MPLQKSIRSITVAAGLSAILGALLCAPAGCKKAGDDQAADAANAANDDGGASGDGGGSGGDEIVTDMSRESFDQMKSLWQTQVAAPVASAETLRKIAVQHNDRKMTHRRRSINGSVALRVPPDVIETACRPYLHGPRPRRVNALVSEDDYTIVAAFGMRYRGIVQYYLLARNVYWLNRLQWVMQTSMLPCP